MDLLKADSKDLLSITALRFEETYIKLLSKCHPAEVIKKRGKLIFLQCIKKVAKIF
jgi:hypothetical protein